MAKKLTKNTTIDQNNTTTTNFDLLRIFKDFENSANKKQCYINFVAYGISQIKANSKIDLEMLNRSQYFYQQFQQNQNIKYFAVSQILRRAAHTVYRKMNKLDLNKKENTKFLRLIT